MGWHVLKVRPGEKDQRQRVALEGVEYILDLRWSSRASRWTLDLFAASGAAIYSGIALTLAEPLLGPLHLVTGMPPGELVLIDPRAERAAPTLATLGEIVSLVYVDSEHVGAAGTEPRLQWGPAPSASSAAPAAPALGFEFGGP